ncbi:ABC transporter ATP-binding protein [Spirochaeta isovalerica]|uniref:ABC-type Fe3+/spermidine/putrescine transport system ATPase subunit n=1 Tax=Spirochaeta isovalerica TaxID=150 RepID=A0A841R7H3_9SPIO|nr:ABC transporter ATP-binding protein [Spirochaeta isovalerica]MBB6478990.1 ABC-type Fe3+/spermidine/putrescine transport system ATPase subunit [Spirochaeta isovalerica]
MSITLNDIHRDFGDFKLHMNLQAEKGELISLLGPSGCGKSTTLRIIAGFEEADSGSLFLEGKDLLSISPEKREIAMVFQDYALFPHMTVFDNIAYGPKIRKWSKEKIREEVNRFLKIVHLEGFADRKTEMLSGGEQQRVALARALITEPKLLLLDEPLSALDARLRKKLRREIRNIQRELEITTLYVTHDQEEALAISDKIALIDNGECIQFDTPQNLYRKPQHIFAAGFIGNANLIPVGNIDLKSMSAETEMGKFSVDYIREGSDEKFIFFRSDKCLIVRDDNPELSNMISGTVVDEEYTGSRKDLEIQVGNQIIRASVPEDSPVAVNDMVTLHIPEQHCRVL